MRDSQHLLSFLLQDHAPAPDPSPRQAVHFVFLDIFLLFVFTQNRLLCPSVLCSLFSLARQLKMRASSHSCRCYGCCAWIHTSLSAGLFSLTPLFLLVTRDFLPLDYYIAFLPRCFSCSHHTFLSRSLFLLLLLLLALLLSSISCAFKHP